MPDPHNGHPCPNCGCRDSRPAGNASRWGSLVGRRQCRHCGRAFTPTPGPAAADPPPMATEEDEEDDMQGTQGSGFRVQDLAPAGMPALDRAPAETPPAAVIYRPLRCPQCSSTAVRVARKRKTAEGDPTVRDMKCRQCGAAFKCIEA